MRRILLIILLCLASTAYAQSKNNCKAVQLTCEHLVNPLGIEASRPRLSWRLEDRRKGALQQAYQILLAQDSLELSHGAKANWDSGKQLSSSMLVRYNGTELKPRPTFCLELKIEYTDGTWQTVVSDKQWKVATGPIIYNNIYTGEHYDARLDMPGWDRPKFEDSAWHTVQYRTPPSTHIVSQQMVPVRLGNVIRPKSVTKIDQRTYVFDMGQNMAGITRNSTSHSVILVVHSLIVFFVY